MQGKRKETAMSNCPRCGSEVKVRKATQAKPYVYKISGLSDLFLCGIKVESCTKCGLEAPTIPRQGQLHRLINDNLLAQTTGLTGEEFRYLRTEAGFASKEFAALLGITAIHLSRIENKKNDLTEPIDRLGRWIVGRALDSDAGYEVLVEHARRLQAHGEPGKAPCYLIKNNRWKQKTA